MIPGKADNAASTTPEDVSREPQQNPGTAARRSWTTPRPSQKAPQRPERDPERPQTAERGLRDGFRQPQDTPRGSHNDARRLARATGRPNEAWSLFSKNPPSPRKPQEAVAKGKRTTRGSLENADFSDFLLIFPGFLCFREKLESQLRRRRKPSQESPNKPRRLQDGPKRGSRMAPDRPQRAPGRPATAPRQSKRDPQQCKTPHESHETAQRSFQRLPRRACRAPRRPPKEGSRTDDASPKTVQEGATTMQDASRAPRAGPMKASEAAPPHL